MPNRITKKLVTFRNPFVLASRAETWPAGDYTIETEEEPLENRSFISYRRIETIMVVRPGTGKQGTTQFLKIDPLELDEALMKDRKRAEHLEAEDVTGQAENEGMQAT